MSHVWAGIIHTRGTKDQSQRTIGPEDLVPQKMPLCMQYDLSHVWEKEEKKSHGS